jgi:L-iditol 2-dehydrogenase
MKAYSLYGKEDMRPEELDQPAVGSNDLLIKVLACGVCGSDLRMYFKGPSPRYNLPVVLGHEIAGRVVEIGAEVAGYQIGDVVTLAPIVPCMRCYPCSRGQDNLCENGGVLGTTVQGGFAELIRMPAAMVHAGGVVKVPEGVDFRAAALTELVGTCLHGLRQTRTEAGDRVLILGDGPIGLVFLQLAKLMGARYVAVSGRRPRRRALAEELGADEVLDADKAKLAERFARSLDLVIVATSNPDALAETLNIVRPGGDLLLFSGYPYGTTMSLDLFAFHYRELHIHGSIDAPIRDFQKAASLLPQLQTGRLVSSSFPLDEAVEAFRAARLRDAIKVLIEP